MKKTISMICMFVVALCCQAHAQYVSVHAYDVSAPSGGHTIVRSWDRGHAVTYYVTSDSTSRIEVVEQSTGNIQWINMPNYVFLKDMCIDEQSGFLYFCGSTNYYAYYAGLFSGYGLLGWLDLNSFYTANVNPGYLLINDLNSVNKLVEYDNAGTSQIVAIGETRYTENNYVYSQYYMVDCRDITGTTPLLYVDTFTRNERYDDVLLTGKHVVFMGYYADPTAQSLCYRKTPRINIHSMTLNNIHLFYNGDDVLSLTHSTTMFEDTIATTYYSTNGNGNYVTRIRVLDIFNDINTLAEEFILDDKSEPDDIIHIPADNSLVLMQKFYTSNGSHNSNFVFIDQYATPPYLAIIEYLKREYFESLTMHNSNYYLAGTGATWFLKDKTQSPTNIPSENCPDVDKITVKDIDILLSYLIPHTIGLTLWPYDPNNDTPMVNPSSTQINCSNR